jgi:ankyrin repeat protein
MLHNAIAKNNWQEVQKLLHLSYINVNERDRTLQTPLHAVSTMGHKNVAEVLLQKGADVNAIDTNNWAPIHCAASNGHLELVKLLLEQPKIDVSVLSKDGTSMFHYLMRYQRSSPADEKQYLAVLQKSISLGVDVTLHGKHLETPLHQATVRANRVAIDFLLCNGAHIDAQNK